MSSPPDRQTTAGSRTRAPSFSFRLNYKLSFSQLFDGEEDAPPPYGHPGIPRRALKREPIPEYEGPEFSLFRLDSPGSPWFGSSGISRRGTTGHPPKEVSALGDGKTTPPRFQISRRATLADRPELDHLIPSWLTTIEGHKYLPLTPWNLFHMSPLWKGEKPLADTTVFEYLLVNREIQYVEADVIQSALSAIGGYCKHFYVEGNIQVEVHGKIFKKSHAWGYVGDDGERLMNRLPNLETITFTHREDRHMINAVIPPYVRIIEPYDGH
ncbi:hypothetical protein BS50DRAFT_153261 [Corynespora cassiicola Philippines]|uniref:Uncharacterized protein n=1 Tax=Corynespora cassiicola Philippines TaxID=1448308 RepID=A0A2T2N7X7_CORCC|nr:hypothetical protein BS50DRAFT_153261 [Corynespora cassiicola Philippines]